MPHDPSRSVQLGGIVALHLPGRTSEAPEGSSVLRGTALVLSDEAGKKWLEARKSSPNASELRLLDAKGGGSVSLHAGSSGSWVTLKASGDRKATLMALHDRITLQLYRLGAGGFDLNVRADDTLHLSMLSSAGVQPKSEFSLEVRPDSNALRLELADGKKYSIELAEGAPPRVLIEE